ncbi:2647_t:CDS:2 [Funneliformis mosseae]|uniref:2647_t:CDS:1 n=1 Tax=Funneliformis mosseae TaxID=27381 RepID=A0A9N9C6V8_FUNMO|nr:2647_t:CDS:2 [Funneliformis mosseae]
MPRNQKIKKITARWIIESTELNQDLNQDTEVYISDGDNEFELDLPETLKPLTQNPEENYLFLPKEEYSFSKFSVPSNIYDDDLKVPFVDFNEGSN